jgi:hypothetical protein
MNVLTCSGFLGLPAIKPIVATTIQKKQRETYLLTYVRCYKHATNIPAQRGRSQTVETREAKALELADRGRVVRDGDGWLVFSLTSTDRYRVQLAPTASCSCSDFDLRQADCKHILATLIIASRMADGCPMEPVPETVPVVWPKPTYRQDWPNYDLAQIHEQDHFQPTFRTITSQLSQHFSILLAEWGFWRLTGLAP